MYLQNPHIISTHRVIHVSGRTPLDSGEDRVVYPHPDDDLCIKIPKKNFQDLSVRGIRNTVFLLSRLGQKEYFDYNFVDVHYAQRLEGLGGIEMFRHIPRCYGCIETDLGAGVVWQRICNFDKTPSLTLKEMKDRGYPLTTEEKQFLWTMLKDFFSWQLKNGILLREMAVSNTMLCRLSEEESRLYHVDAIGCVDIIPLASYVRWVARLRVLSKISNFRKRIIHWLGPAPG